MSKNGACSVRLCYQFLGEWGCSSISLEESVEAENSLKGGFFL